MSEVRTGVLEKTGICINHKGTGDERIMHRVLITGDGSRMRKLIRGLLCLHPDYPERRIRTQDGYIYQCPDCGRYVRYIGYMDGIFVIPEKEYKRLTGQQEGE